MIKDQLDLERLCSPYTHHPLQLISAAGREKLVDSETGQTFSIQENMPCFIRPEDMEETNGDSTAFYNSFAPFYEMGQKLYYAFLGGEAKARHDYLKYLSVNEGDRVLEVSVGTGANIRCLRRDACYYGLDLSKGQLKQCQKNNEKYHLNTQLVWGNAEYLPFQDESFDVVYHIGGINTFNNKKQALKEMVRVAKKGTRLLVADETEKVAAFYAKIPYFRGPFKNRKEPYKAPVEDLPEGVKDVEVTEIRKGTLYCLQFTKI